MKRILIWGTEKVYDQYINALKYQELLGNIKVIGVTSEYYSYECVDGYSFVDVENIDYLSFDILVVAARRKEERFKDILSKARQNNILEENILPIEVFAIPGFTVEKYLYLARGGGYLLWHVIAGAA